MSNHRLWQHPDFRQGAKEMMPVTPGIAAWGLMTGVAMAKSGLSLVESLAMALLVFSGTSQLAALPLILAGAPIAVILATGFCVNLRFTVFSLHLRPYMMHLPLSRRLMYGYLTADLTYVLFVQRFAKASHEPELREGQEAYFLGSSLLNWASWVIPCVAGVLLADAIPERWGLSFAGTLALVGIACSLATSRLRIVSASIAGAAAIAAFALPMRLNILVAIAVAVVVCLSLRGVRTQERT